MERVPIEPNDGTDEWIPARKRLAGAGAWVLPQQEALWFHGGNLHQSRHYSQFLSLQIKARMEGIATLVYGKAAVYHKS